MEKLSALVPSRLKENWNRLCWQPKDHDLNDFQKKINNNNISLSKFVFEIFGKKLNKSQQNS
jgi:hypothetical protein